MNEQTIEDFQKELYYSFLDFLQNPTTRGLRDMQTDAERYQDIWIEDRAFEQASKEHHDE